MSGDEAVAIHHIVLHAEIVAAMPHQLIELFERAFIQQQLYSLAR